MEQLLARGKGMLHGNACQGLLQADEAERLVETLRIFCLEEVCSGGWMDQRQTIEKLNLQAHYNAQTHSDEFILELLVSHNKVGILVHELLVMEIWREKLLPLLMAHLAKKVDTVTSYYIIYHEATIANLLEVSLFDPQVFNDIEEDLLLEMCDWCQRNLLYLLQQDQHIQHDEDIRDILKMNEMEELEVKCREASFITAISSLTILRYLSDNLRNLPMGITSRLLCVNDVIMALISLIHTPPWVRERKGKTQKFLDNAWRTVDSSDRLKITQLDGQVWLTLCTLLVEPKCREKYNLDDYRRDKILGLPRYFNDFLFDQLPMLKDLERCVDHIILGVGSNNLQSTPGLIIEQIPMYRTTILKEKNWNAIATKMKSTSLGEDCDKITQKRRTEMLKCIDFMCDISNLDEISDRSEKTAGSSSKVKLEARVCVRNTSIWERIAEYDFDIDYGYPPEPIEVSVKQATVRGHRYKAKPSNLDACAPLPPTTKVIVHYNGNTADARAELPAPSTKSEIRELPSIIWLTAGLLATDGFALQVKLKKIEDRAVRNKLDGIWHVYCPVGGAITLKIE